MTELKAGTRLLSQVCTTEVIVVKAPAGDSTVTCGGQDMVLKAEDKTPGLALDDSGEGSVLGKRYTDAEGTIELLVTKAGPGTLGLNGEALALKEARALPASD